MREREYTFLAFQRRSEVMVDQKTVNVWTCPPQSRSGAIVRAHWSGMRERSYNFKLYNLWLSAVPAHEFLYLRWILWDKIVRELQTLNFPNINIKNAKWVQMDTFV